MPTLLGTSRRLKLLITFASAACYLLENNDAILAVLRAIERGERELSPYHFVTIILSIPTRHEIKMMSTK